MKVFDIRTMKTIFGRKRERVFERRLEKMLSKKFDVRGSVHYSIIHIENPTRCNSVSKFVLYLYEAQHVSGDTPPIIRSLKLYQQPLVLHTWKVVGRVVAGQRPAATLPTTFHVCKTRGCWYSFKLLMMGGVSPETCWASYKYEINFDTLLHLVRFSIWINPLNAELNPICYLLALLAHHFLHVTSLRVKSLTLRLLMSYIYIYGAPILDVSRSHTMTQHSR